MHRARVPKRRLVAASKASLPHSRTVHTTVDPAEIAHFSRLSAQWWDEQGEFALLHRMNPVRIQFILDKLREAHHADTSAPNHERVHPPARALDALDVLDVGCGGGLLSETLARLGAHTLGIDASPANIAIASLHASFDPRLSPPAAHLRYQHAPAETLLSSPARFDIVCAMEVLEHVDSPSHFLRACGALVKPGGHIFLSTIARTPLAFFLTILMAERVLGAVAPHTHTYSKFINPSELLAFFRDEMRWFHAPAPGRLEAEVRGIMYIPWEGRWILADRAQPASAQCNYIFWARKPHA